MQSSKSKGRPTTIHQVAAQAGVSIKTVSRVVNREPAVKPATRQRVLKAIEALSYRPNAAARSLASSHSYFVALVYDNPSESYLLHMQAGALEACREEGHHLLLHPCDYRSPRLIEELLALVTARGHPGLVLTPPICDNAALIQRLDALAVNYVRMAPVDRRHPAPHVWVDDRSAAYDLSRYLLDIGHRRIGFIKGHPDHGASHPRFEGFRQALRERKIAADKNLIVQGFFSFESGEQCARVLLSRAPAPTAIFASNDEMAAGVLHVAHELGIEVPQKLSVAGFDDTTLSRHTWPALTTVHQPMHAMAKASVQALIERMRRPGKQHEPTALVFPYKLVIRGSTGAASPSGSESAAVQHPQIL